MKMLYILCSVDLDQTPRSVAYLGFESIPFTGHVI